MKRTANIGASSETVTCESVGHTADGRAIWKNVDDAFECFTYEAGAFWAYEPDSALDDLSELYGTYVGDDGNRADYELDR